MPSVDYTAIRQACQPVPRVVDPCPMVRFASKPRGRDVTGIRVEWLLKGDPRTLPGYRGGAFLYAPESGVIDLPKPILANHRPDEVLHATLNLGPGGECVCVTTRPGTNRRVGRAGCQLCDGSGTIPDPLERECDNCDGYGRYGRGMFISREPITCTVCHGSGRVRATRRERCGCVVARRWYHQPTADQNCPDCHGTGERDVPEDYPPGDRPRQMWGDAPEIDHHVEWETQTFDDGYINTRGRQIDGPVRVEVKVAIPDEPAATGSTVHIPTPFFQEGGVRGSGFTTGIIEDPPRDFGNIFARPQDDIAHNAAINTEHAVRATRREHSRRPPQPPPPRRPRNTGRNRTNR